MDNIEDIDIEDLCDLCGNPRDFNHPNLHEIWWQQTVAAQWKLQNLEFELREKERIQKIVDRSVKKTLSVVPIVSNAEVGKAPEGYGSIYELTLTTDVDDPYSLRTALSKIVASSMFEVLECRACVELTEKGLPHIHAILYSKKKYLDASKIKGKPVNFAKRYELKRVRSEEAFNKYILKEKNNVVVSSYCEKKGILQFWDGKAV